VARELTEVGVVGLGTMGAGIAEVLSRADDVGAAMKVGCGYPRGPFEVLRAVGLDVALAVQRDLCAEFRESGLAPAPLPDHLVTVGRGFRDQPAS
jgi:3-hydroxybutyryl-CoA dehydrogenase